MPAEQIVYVDETGMDQFPYREYARAPRGETVFGAISSQKFNRVGIVAAQCKGTILSPLEYDGSMDSSLYEYRFENILLPELPPNAVIVMDNASFHRKSALLELIGKTDASLLFWPPYSSDLNPIEHFGAWLKRKFQELLSSFDSFDTAISACFVLE